MMRKFVNIFLIIASLTFFSQIEAVDDLNNESNNIEDENICYVMELQVYTNKLDVIIESENKKISYPVSGSANIPSNCIEATKLTRKSGIYEIFVPKFTVEPLEVYCNEDIEFGGWTVILRRFDGSVNFNRNWNEYKEGFGNLRGEFFIGLEKLHALTTLGPTQELYFAMESTTAEKKYAKYDTFVIGSEDEGYSINELGIFRGNVEDAFRNHKSKKFSTMDRDNDNNNGHCADDFDSGWWFTDCFSVLLTGIYNPANNVRHDMRWKNSNGKNAWEKLKSAQMMIRSASANEIGKERKKFKS